MTTTTSPTAIDPGLLALRLQRILVPTDFSEASRQTLPLAVDLARQFGATISLVHVFPTSLPDEMSHIGIVFEQKRLACEAGARLARFRETELPANLKVETVLLEGGPAHEVATFARDSQSDLIIASTCGRTGLKHFWLGSTAERIVRHAPCPVLVTRQPLVSVRFPGDVRCRFQRILVPTDFGDASRTAFRYAAAFAQPCGSEVTLIHVIEPPPYPEFGYAHIPAKEAKLKRDARKKLEAHCQEFTGCGVNAASAIRGGSAFHEITEEARERRADLIVIATHGRGALAHALIGSTAERVVRHAPCPVLVVRERERDFVTA